MTRMQSEQVRAAKSFLGRLRNDRRGVALVMTTLMIAGLLAFMGLVFDGGRLYFEKRRMQTGADAGAIGGAYELFRGNSEAVIISGGRDDAKLNGYDNAAPAVNVAINHPPTAGPYSGDNRYVEAIVTQPMPTTFMRVLNFTDAVVAARAVAGVEVDNTTPCILALKKTGKGGLTVSGTAELNAPNCAVMVNSNDPRAIIANGGGCINASDIGFVEDGSYVTNGGGCVDPQPTGRALAEEDPWADLPEPLPPYLPVQSASRLTINGDRTLLPGYYKGGIKINGGNVNFQPGLYIVDGLEITGGTVKSLTGSAPYGTTFYNTGAGLRNININGNATATLIAPNDPGYIYNNMLFFNSRSIPDTPPNGASIEGNANSTFEGRFYFPTVDLKVAGISSNTLWMEVIAYTINITGNSTFNNNFDGSGRAADKLHIALVE